MAIYNKFHYLKKSISTLKEQTYENFEIIAVDDCSTDNSSEYLIEQMKKYSKIKLIQHIYNQGTLSSQNDAILNSNGYYIMQLDPDDEYISTSIENAYKTAILYNADVLEYAISVNFLGEISKKFKNYTIQTCQMNYTNNDPLLTKFQKFKYDRTNWNTCKKIIKRSVYLSAVKLILPFVENKRICNAEDLLHSGVVYIFMKNYFCGNFLSYVYYKALPDSQTLFGYFNERQSRYQYKYCKLLVRYFFENRHNLENCNLNNFLNNSENLKVYNNVIEFNREHIKNFSCNIKGFKCSFNIQKSFCLIMKK